MIRDGNCARSSVMGYLSFLVEITDGLPWLPCAKNRSACLELGNVRSQVRSAVNQQMKSLLDSEDESPVSEDQPAQHHRAHRAAKRGAWRIAGDLPSSFRYAAYGLGYGFVSQLGFTFLGDGDLARLPAIQLAVLVLTVAVVLVLELLNTAIEATVDLAIGAGSIPREILIAPPQPFSSLRSAQC